MGLLDHNQLIADGRIPSMFKVNTGLRVQEVVADATRADPYLRDGSKRELPVRFDP